MTKYRLMHGNHYRRENGKMVRYRKDDVIEANEFELRGALDKFEIVGPPDPPPKMADPPMSLKAIHKGGGRWDVINVESGKKINVNLLTRDEAQALISDGSILDDTETLAE